MTALSAPGGSAARTRRASGAAAISRHSSPWKKSRAARSFSRPVPSSHQSEHREHPPQVLPPGACGRKRSSIRSGSGCSSPSPPERFTKVRREDDLKGQDVFHIFREIGFQEEPRTRSTISAVFPEREASRFEECEIEQMPLPARPEARAQEVEHGRRLLAHAPCAGGLGQAVVLVETARLIRSSRQ